MSSVSEDDDQSMAPQEVVEDFWENLITKKPSKVTNIFPPSLYTNLLPPLQKPGKVTGQNAAESYQAAADECRARVKRIVRECHRTNQKFTDPEFDIEDDRGVNNCLEGIASSLVDPEEGGDDGTDASDVGEALKVLSKISATTAVTIDLASTVKALSGGASSSESANPGSIHRIDWIFENPAFTVDGFSSSDVRQGQNGDCWFIAAVASICSNPSLMDRVCVERDEECGVYGFVFYRDGEWTWTVVDDNLYLQNPDFDVYGDYYDSTGAEERKWKKSKQTGSDALYFASCADPNETWLPLLEKAYAKVHGDYEAIAGGWSGEGVEDLTGGVTTTVMTNRILSKERLWKELLRANQEFLFTASANHSSYTSTQKGLTLNHAYSVIKAVEAEDEQGKKHRLVQIRNPWGKRSWNGSGEWNGAWGDGAKEWTPYWMDKLNYRFADDGLFWMSFDDLQTRFRSLDRTRLFDRDWTVVQQWTSVDVAWVTGYLNTKFVVEIHQAGPTVFVLCQLDDRYFKGLEGKYRFDLHFILQEDTAAAGGVDHIVRARGAMRGNRSISAEVDLDPGTYHVVPKIAAYKDDDAIEIHEAVKKLAKNNPQKLRQIGLNYDIANAKGITEEQKKAKEEKERKKSEAEKKRKEEEEKERKEFEAWKKEKREKKQDEASSKAKKEDAEQPAEEKKDQSSTTNTSEKKTDKEPSNPADDDDSEETSDSESESEDPQKQDADSKPTTSSTTKPKPPPQSSPDASSSSTDPPPTNNTTTNDNDSDSDDSDSDSETDEKKEKEKEKDKQNSWNAVCVLGLRVYARDPAVSIKLVRAACPEEAAVLDADGAVTAVGATM